MFFSDKKVKTNFWTQNVQISVSMTSLWECFSGKSYNEQTIIQMFFFFRIITMDYSNNMSLLSMGYFTYLTQFKAHKFFVSKWT